MVFESRWGAGGGLSKVKRFQFLSPQHTYEAWKNFDIAWSVVTMRPWVNGAELCSTPGCGASTMSDTIAILQIHPKIQYLQLSVAADIFEPPTKSAKLYFVILWHFVCIVIRRHPTFELRHVLFYIHIRQSVTYKLFYLHIN